MTISVLNYGAGNLKSISNLMDFIGVEYKIINTSKEIDEANILILPGVGHFEQLMSYFEENNLKESLIKYIKSGRPYLGICLGMQILFESSEEAPDKPGLSIFPGKVLRFAQGKVPQIGWNKLKVSPECTELTEDYFYFVNSFYVNTDEKDIIASTTSYNVDFISAVQKDNILAVQFHPEKSGKAGIEIVKRWLKNVS